MDEIENIMRGWQAEEDEHKEAMCQHEEEWKKRDEDQLLEAQKKQEEYQRNEEQQKEEPNHRVVGFVHDRVQIAEYLNKDLKVVTPPTFNGKISRKEMEAWIAIIEKYFHVCNFTRKSRAVWATFQLANEATIWW